MGPERFVFIALAKTLVSAPEAPPRTARRSPAPDAAAPCQ